MTDEEIVVALTGHDHEIGSIKHRMKGYEKQVETIHSIVVSIEKSALNMGRAWQRNLKNKRNAWEILKVSRRLV